VSSVTSTRARVHVAARAQVIRNTPLCDEHYQLDLSLTGFPPSHPGQFVQALCRDSSVSACGSGSRAYLRRPFSIADRYIDDAQRDIVSIIHRAIGPGTRWLADRTPGDLVDITGPLGRGFQVDDATQQHILVGGGVGIPPLLYLARLLRGAGSNVTAIFGARSRILMPLACNVEPARDATPTCCVRYAGFENVPAVITSDDGSIGFHGFVTDALAALMERSEYRDAATIAYACGPEPMLRAVSHLTRKRGVDCQLCIERMMGCGLGTCLSCIVRVVDESGIGWRYALTCQEGPVFERDLLVEHTP
jgi:dihydroorotate dehydrogenase electron transfer subunit